MEKHFNKRKLLISSIGTLLLLSAVFLSSYAYYYFSGVDISNKANVNTIIGNKLSYTFSSTTMDSISFNITGGEMLQGSTIGTALVNELANMNITFNSEESLSKYCTYDIVWQWDETDIENNRYYMSTGATNELTISGSSETLSFPETQLNNYGLETTLASRYIVSDSASDIVQNWTYNLRFYNLDINQDTHELAQYSGKILIKNVDCSLGALEDILIYTIASTASSTYNNPASFANMILANNGGKDAIEAKGAPDFSQQAPVLTYAEGTLSSGTATATPNEDYYFTFANSYSLDPITGKYTLKNEDEDGNKTAVTLDNNVVQYKADPNALVGMYVGDVSGTANRSLYVYSNRIYIYKIMSVDTVTGKFTYKPLLPIVSNVDNTADGVYAADDDYTAITGRKSYYYRGAVDNNWVSFAGKYWRIIRINGDGSIRIMYSGTIAPTEETKVVMTNSSTQLSGRAFNTTRDSAEYVGWKYTLGEGHGYANSSTIKGDDSSPTVGSVDEWYYSNIVSNSTYLSKINQNQILCNDRTSYTSTAGTTPASGTGTTLQYFGPYIRNIARNEPSLICPLAEDKFTVDGIVTGNETLTYPVGLITADEVKIAGLIHYSYNIKNYLYNGRYYWTASPYVFSGNYAYAFYVSGYGYLNSGSVASTLGARPVVSLKSDIAVTGTGQYNDPYVVN